jgi:hypothetical protein
MKIKSQTNHKINLLTLNWVLWRKYVIMFCITSNYEQNERLWSAKMHAAYLTLKM